MNGTLTAAPTFMLYAPSVPANTALLPLTNATSADPLFHTVLPDVRSQVPFAGSIVAPLLVFPLSQTSPAVPTNFNCMLDESLVMVQTPPGIVPGTKVPEPVSEEYCIRI